MKQLPHAFRKGAVFLCLSLSLPNSAWALRPQEKVEGSGLEQGLPKDAGGLKKSLSAILKDWLLELPFSQSILPELEIALHDPLPSLPTLVLYALKGTGGRVETVIGIMTLQDAQGNTVYAYFV